MKSFSEEWEKTHSTQEWGRYPSETVIRFIARNYYKTEREKIKILDFGCGAGLTPGIRQEKDLMCMRLMAQKVQWIRQKNIWKQMGIRMFILQ